MQLLNLHKQYEYPVQLNSDGYRAPEWQDVNWGESILLFGTSQTFGVGCDFEHTVGHILEQQLGVRKCIWLPRGVVDDDTDGHIDDTIRFVNEDTVLTVVESNKNDENYSILQDNLAQLKQMRLLNGKQLNIVELPMPADVIYEDQMLPASYANFYISNGHIIVPTFRCNKDDKAMQIIQSCFPTRQVVGIDSTDIIWGLGSFHCLSQQEPAI